MCFRVDGPCIIFFAFWGVILCCFGGRDAKYYGPYSQIRKYLGLYFAVFTVNKAKYTPPSSYLAAPKFILDVPVWGGVFALCGYLFLASAKIFLLVLPPLFFP